MIFKSRRDVLAHGLLRTGTPAPKIVCNGAVAQLGERRVRNAKVGSSILLRSTNLHSPLLPPRASPNKLSANLSVLNFRHSRFVSLLGDHFFIFRPQ